PVGRVDPDVDGGETGASEPGGQRARRPGDHAVVARGLLQERVEHAAPAPLPGGVEDAPHGRLVVLPGPGDVDGDSDDAAASHPPILGTLAQKGKYLTPFFPSCGHSLG